MTKTKPRILVTCTYVAAEAALAGQGRMPCPQFADTYLSANNGFIHLEWLGEIIAAIFPNNMVVVVMPTKLNLESRHTMQKIADRLAALFPNTADVHVDTRSGSPFVVATVNGPTGPDTGTAYTLGTGTILNFLPWACNHAHRLDEEKATAENAFDFARRKAREAGGML